LEGSSNDSSVASDPQQGQLPPTDMKKVVILDEERKQFRNSCSNLDDKFKLALQL